MTAIEVQDPSTWPTSITSFAEEWAAELAGSTECPGDLLIPHSEQERCEELLNGFTLRTYHCTRLIDLEVLSILENGLTPTSEDLVTLKLDAAHGAGLLTTAQRDHLQTRNVLTDKGHQMRRGEVCVLLGRNALDEDGDGLVRLLTLWGGELTYWLHNRDPETLGLLQSIGRPSVVVVDVPALPDRSKVTVPEPAKLFVARLLGLPDAYGEAHLVGASGLEVAAIWQPGDPEYNRHSDLPRE